MLKLETESGQHAELVKEHNLLVATTVAARQSLAAHTAVDPITTSLGQLADEASALISTLANDKAALVAETERLEAQRVEAELCVSRVERRSWTDRHASEANATHKRLEATLAEAAATTESLVQEKAALESCVAPLVTALRS